MGVDKDDKVMVGGLLDDASDVIEISLVVDPRTSVFDGFPGDKETYKG
jgi:hypothetical protein